MKFVVKSMDRLDEYSNMTYKYLKNNSVNDSDIFIFVSKEKDLIQYKERFPEQNIILGPKGIANIDNFITDYFDEGEKFVYLNDDIREIYFCKDSKTLEVIKFESLVTKAFKIMEKNNLTYGGLYPVMNPYFMVGQKEPISTKFCLIMDPMSFCINNKNIKLTNFDCSPNFNENNFTDFEKSILHFKDRGGILRFNHFVLDVKYFNGASTSNRKGKNVEINAEKMMAKYPDYISGIKELKKHKGFFSLRLKRKVGIIINDE